MASIGPIESLDVQKKKISEILGPWAESLRIPVVQREFEWQEEDIKALIDSITRSYPVGTIIIWESYEKFPNSKVVGANVKDDQDGPFRYVIDGQQRLISLLLVSNAWQISRGKETIKTEPIAFNPATNDFRIGGNVGIDVSLLMNAAMAKANALKELSNKYSGYESALEYVGSKLSNYELPIYTLKTPKHTEVDPEIIADIFTRINKSGAALGNLQMFLSFFASAFPNLKDTILERYNDLNDNYSDEYPSWEASIRAVFGNLGQSQNRITRIKSFKAVINDIKSNYGGRPEEMKSLVEGSFKAMNCGLSLIKEEFGISNQRFLPSQNVLIPIYKWLFKNKIFSTDKIQKNDKNHILKWFLISSANNYYTSSTNRKLEDSLEIITQGTEFPIDLLLKKMKEEIKTDSIDLEDVINEAANKAKQMLLFSLLYRKGASDWAGHPITSSNVTLQHIFPKNLLSDNYELSHINKLSNLTFINGPLNSELKDKSPEVYLQDFNENLLRQHLIPTERSTWKIENFEEFIQKRDSIIKDEIDEMLHSME